MRRSPKVAEVLPVLYLRGLSTGDFRDALAALLGDDAAGLSATNIARLTNEWEAEYRAFQQRSLADRDYVYVWVDGVHFNVRLEDDRLCTLAMIGVRADGTKELIAVEDGQRESAESWKTVLRDLKRRGMRAPVVAVGDGALGFWTAVRDVWPKTREQRGWFHKRCTPKRGSRRARRSRGSPARTGPSIRRPSRRWRRTPTRCSPSSTSQRSTGSISGSANVIESPFATVRLRQRVTKGAGSRTKGLLMAYKLLDMTQARWRRRDGAHLLRLVRAGIVFVDGVQPEGRSIKTKRNAA